MMRQLSIICSFFVMFLCEAQEQTRLPLSDYFSETWNTRSGLPHNSINSVTQTQDGYLWVATWEGLARFNGQEFTILTRAHINNLPDSGLRALTPTNSGGLYIAGSRGGISLYQHRQWDTKRSASTMVNHLIESADQSLWLALENDGVFYREHNSDTDLAIIKNVSAYRVIEDHDGVIWAATSAGLYKIHNKIPTLMTPHFGLPNAPVYNLLITRGGSLIVGSEKGAWIKTKAQFQPIHEKLSNESISSLLEDNHGDLWFGTINKGVFRLSPDGVEQLDANNGLPANRILSLLQDRENSIWIGTNAGLFRLRESPFSSWTQKRGLAGDYTRTVLSHSDGSLWVGGSSGLNIIKNNRATLVSGSKQSSPYSVLSLHEAPDGSVWAGTYTSGVLKIVNNTFTPFINRSTGLGSNEVRALLFDSKNRLWIGSAMGLTRINEDGSLNQFTNKKDLPSGFVLALSEDNAGNIWVGTGNGVVVFDIVSEQFTTVEFPREFSAQYAFGFYIDETYTWMATDRGLVRYELTSGKMAMLGLEQGLPIDKLFQVVPHNGSFWLSSNRGIIQIDKNHIQQILDAPASAKAPVLNYQLYDEGDGMLSAQANGGSTPSAVTHNDGSIWFATAKGVSTVKPARLQASTQIALPTIIENIFVDGKPIALPLEGESVFLPPGVSRLSFHYAGLSFIMPQRLNFQTQLKGFNDKWVNRQHMTGAEYTNLPPGEYTFMVRASYPNAQWQDNQQAVNIVIQSFFWQKPQFKFAVFVLFLMVIFAIYKYRLYHYKKIEIELTNRVEKQTQDLQTQANAFAYQATHDQLTDMPNRRAFDSWLAHNFATYKQQNRPLAIAILDIDHFKRINDNWSHIIGDKVICTIAELLKNGCQENQHIARWGGEEFTIVFADKTAGEAKIICEALRESIAQHDFSAIGEGLSVTASFGLSDSTNVGDYDRLLSRADQALYKAKNSGRNCTEII